MCTCNCQLPFARRFTYTASSKSRAVSPSIVTIGRSRKSRRPTRSGIAHRMRHGGSFRQYFLRKLVREMMFANQDFDVHPEIARPPKNFDHASSRRHAAARKTRQLHVDDGAIKVRRTRIPFSENWRQLRSQLRRQALRRRDNNLLQQPRFVRRYPYFREIRTGKDQHINACPVPASSPWHTRP